MQEVKKPDKKPWVFYYIIALAVVIFLNFLIIPIMESRQIEEVDYGTFLDMINEKNIGLVNIEDNQIVFTDESEENIYKTGVLNDADLVNRLYEAGATFSSEIVEETSPFVSILLGWVLPIVIFVAVGQLMFRRMSSKLTGGENAMQFGMGKSNAKVYVKSTGGVSFDDVAGEDEAKEVLS
ncbi:MAG: ATP-dependent metallopeptidase FtsH/Yme1/Tma family protein [Clostridiales bacterium]|nr:ATP-dependent metallopeptidase FtsH/Yme1/Tma family protein [Clostridiales bacterium]